MKNKTSKNLLGLSNCFLKSIINCIAEPLVHIFHLSLRKGEIPQQLKCAKVVPIFKLKKSVNDEHLDPSFYIDLFHYCLFSQRFLKKMWLRASLNICGITILAIWALGWFQKKIWSSQGANERVLPTDFRSVFIFFLTLMADFSFPIKVFQNQRGDPWMKKIDFYVWYLKRTALKNVDWKWNRILKILIFVEVMDRKVPKNVENHHNCSKCLFFVLFNP